MIGSSATALPRETARLTFESDQYISNSQTYYREDAGNQLNNMTLLLDGDGKYREITGHIFLKNELNATENRNYFNVHEAYLEISPFTDTTISAGRKLETWAEWEGEWKQGIFQPRYLLNRLQPEQAGLVGLFVDQKINRFKLTVGALPFFVPDLGAHIHIENHKFISKNPWFVPPASQFEFQEEQGDIRYALDKPEMDEVIFHPGAIAKVEFERGNFKGRLSGAYKPMPQLLLGFPSLDRVILGPNSQYLAINVQPRIVYHRLVSADSSIKVGRWTVSGSVTHENPENDFGPQSHTAQQVQPAWIWSASASMPMEQEGPSASRLRFGVLKMNGGDATDRGEFAKSETLFEKRFQYNEAYLVGISKYWRGLFRFPLETDVRVVYDRLQNGGVLSLSSNLNLSASWRAGVELDFMGLLGTDAQIEDGFLARYRANDRVGLGMSYVF